MTWNVEPITIVRCAILIQLALAERNQSVAAEAKVEIRIGIHAGEVLQRDGDVFGNAVNIASRIEGLADPGGICISQAIYDMIRAVPEIRTQSLGLHQLKNIPGKYHLRSVDVRPIASLPTKTSLFKSLAGAPGRVVAVLFSILALAGIGYLGLRAPRDGPSLVPLADQGASDAFELLVVPFVGGPDVKDEARFVQALIIQRLENILRGDNMLRVTRGSADTKIRTHLQALALARERGVQALIWGEILQLGDELSIQPRLSVAASLYRIKALTTTPLHLRRDAPDRIVRHETKADDVADLVNIAAGAYFMKRSPHKAWAALQKIRKPTSDSVLLQGLSLYHRDQKAEAESYLARAVELDPENALAHAALSLVRYRLGRLDEAIASGRTSIHLEPRVDWAYNTVARAYRRQGRNKQAWQLIRQGPRAVPESHDLHYTLGHLHLEFERFEQARQAFAATVRLQPTKLHAHLFYYLTLRWLGHEQQALAYLRSVQEKLTLHPGSTPAMIVRFLASQATAGSVASLEQAIDQADGASRCQGFYFLGADLALLARELRANVKPARRLLQRTLTSCSVGTSYHKLAAAELRRLLTTSSSGMPAQRPGASTRPN